MRNEHGVLISHVLNLQCWYLEVMIARYRKKEKISILEAKVDDYVGLLQQVKIWCTKQEASALNIDMKANICSVKYNPGSSFHIAVLLSLSLINHHHYINQPFTYIILF